MSESAMKTSDHLCKCTREDESRVYVYIVVDIGMYRYSFEELGLLLVASPRRTSGTKRISSLISWRQKDVYIAGKQCWAIKKKDIWNSLHLGTGTSILIADFANFISLPLFLYSIDRKHPNVRPKSPIIYGRRFVESFRTKTVPLSLLRQIRLFLDHEM